MSARSLAVALVVLGAAAAPAQWQPAGWGGGGLYWACAFHPTQNGVVYMGGDVVGVYRSDNHGQDWKLKNRGIVGYEVLSLAVDPQHPDRVYAATSSGISRSDDRGERWRTLPLSPPSRLNLTVQKGKSIRALAADPQDGKILYFGTPDGRILRSGDHGMTWRLVHELKGGSVASVGVHPGNRDLYAATTSGLLRFVGGVGEPKTVARGVAMAVTFSRDGRIAYAAMSKDGVAASRDGGLTWTASKRGIAADEAAIDVVVDPKDPNRVHCLGNTGWAGSAYRSSDGGRTWVRNNEITGDAESNPTDVALVRAGKIPLSNPRNLAINPLDGQELFIAGNWRPVHSADGGRNWVERSRGADISCVTDIQFHDGKVYATAMDEGLFVSENEGAKWRQLFPLKWSQADSGHQWRVKVWEGGKQILTAGSPWDTPINQVWRSMDSGATFIPVKDGLPPNLPTVDTMWGRGYPRALASHPSNPFTVYLGIDGEPDDKGPGGGIFKSVDGGWHWQRLANQPASRRMFNGLAVDPTDPKRLFWGTCGTKGGLYRSDDGGDSWKRVFDRDDWVFDVLVADDGTVFCPGNELWRSRDHGETWEAISRFGDDLDIVGLAVDPANLDRIWISKAGWSADARGAVMETTDGGKTWASILLDLPNVKPLVLRYNPATRELWAANPGIFRLKR